MTLVQRSEILDYVTYAEQRDAIRDSALEAKKLRRYMVGRYLCFLFDNHETIRYQILEMVRVERIVREADIQHEVDTYNELLGRDGSLGCTLLVGVADPAARDVRLRRWTDLMGTLYARLPDGTKIRPRFDERQVGEDRLSSVQYLHFDVGGVVPLAIGCDHADPELAGELVLSDAQRGALNADLRE